MLTLAKRYTDNLVTWDRCAADYEKAIVCGHPDVRAYEDFEEDFLDALLRYLLLNGEGPLRLLDSGCGSARIHLRYGLKMTPSVPGTMARDIAFDPLIASGLNGIDGVDFSKEMLDIARRKLDSSRIAPKVRNLLRLRQGSAFSPAPRFVKGLPVALAVCNTIGVMQGPEGAQQLFQALRKEVEQEGGIVLISAYRRDAVPTFALGNYESTMNVSGQPSWLRPLRFTSHDVVPIPLEVKRAFDTNPRIRVAANNADGTFLEECILERDPAVVEEVIATGHIHTLWDYESYWYPSEQIAEWIATEWRGLPVWHIDGRQIDSLRAWPVQLAILDAGNRLKGFLSRLDIQKGM